MLDSWIFITSKKKIFSMIQRLDAHADAVNCAEDTFFSSQIRVSGEVFLATEQKHLNLEKFLWTLVQILLTWNTYVSSNFAVT